ncbi:MAG: hypothetical protein ABFR82_13860 [Nitrospirota bacterium]
MMNKEHKSFFIIVALLVLSLVAASEIARAGVMVFDDVVSPGTSIKLKALTKGRFFPQGGRLTEFYVNDKHIGTVLSGGDGYAFYKHTFASPGIYNLKVSSENETGEGVLVAAARNDRVILIEIENTLFEQIITLKPSAEAKKTLQKLIKNYRIIYLTTLFGVQESRKWLTEHEFPASAVLKWEGPAMITDIKEREINMYAIIGSPEMLSETSDIKRRFSFQETEDSVLIKDWDDLLKKLK